MPFSSAIFLIDVHDVLYANLPVSPACNIQRRFCSRTLNKTEQRPGVTAQVLKSEQAVEKVRQALELCPHITVVGIAGLAILLQQTRLCARFGWYMKPIQN